MKYILLFLLSSMLFVSCSNMDPEHYDTPKTPKAQVQREPFKQRQRSYRTVESMLPEKGEVYPTECYVLLNGDTIYAITSDVPLLKTEDYPLNHWRWDHETDVTHYFTNPDGSQTIVQEYNVHRYPCNNTGERNERMISQIFTAMNRDVAEYTGMRTGPVIDLETNAPVNWRDQWKKPDNTGVEALKGVQLYSFWK